jgi:RNA polymerase sigma-70 factor (ECF subfamily)
MKQFGFGRHQPDMRAYVAASTRTAELLARARSGEREAFTEMVERYHSELVRICFAITNDIEGARDAAQSAWIKAWQRLPSVREPERLRSWLIAIAANEARQIVRARRRRKVREITPSEEGGETHMRATDQTRSAESFDLAAVLVRLDPVDRELLAMRYLAGLNATEIAASTGRSASGVRTRLFRIVTRLREEMGDD